MQVRVEDDGTGTRVTLALDAADLKRLRRGKAIDFEVEVSGSKQRCQLLQRGGRSTTANLDHRLFVDAGAINAVSIGGAVAPMFEGVPFGIRLEAAPTLVPATGPVRLSPGVVYHRIDVASSQGPALSGALSNKEKVGFVVFALVCFLIAYALRDYSAVYGFGLMGIGSLWVAFRSKTSS